MAHTNYFDQKASDWDKNTMHRERSETIAHEIIRLVPLKPDWTALEFGAGTGITSFILKDHLKKIILMDNSSEMIRMIMEKIGSTGAENLKALNFDLEHYDYTEEKFNLIFTQMVLHHIMDINDILNKLGKMLKPGGYLAIADLYSEDGSFHGEDFSGHKGFDPGILAGILKEKDFKILSLTKCYTIRKETTDGQFKNFDVFLLIAGSPE